MHSNIWLARVAASTWRSDYPVSRTGPETEVFGPALGSGLDVGDLSFGGGDVILTPGAGGVDVVGSDFDYSDADNAYCDPPAYEADSFTPGASAPPVFPAGILCDTEVPALAGGDGTAKRRRRLCSPTTRRRRPLAEGRRS
jgi:hypothetical protein